VSEGKGGEVSTDKTWADGKYTTRKFFGKRGKNEGTSKSERSSLRESRPGPKIGLLPTSSVAKTQGGA